MRAPTQIRVDGPQCALNLLDWGGSGEPLLLLHGMAAHAHWWDLCAPHLFEKRRVLALDLRGHGDSGWAEPPAYEFSDYASDLEAVRTTLGFSRFALAGHSHGARVAIEYARRYPENLTRLAAIDFVCRGLERDTKRFGPSARARQPVYGSQEEMVSRFRLQPPGTAAPRATLDALARDGVRARPEGGWTWKFDWRAFDIDFPEVWPSLKEVPVPCLILRGELSPILSKEELPRIVSALPRGVGGEIAGAHHHVTLDRPRETAEALLDFFG